MGFRKNVLDILEGIKASLDAVVTQLVEANKADKRLLKVLLRMEQRQNQLDRMREILGGTPKADEKPYNVLQDEELIGLEVEGIENGTD